MGSVCGRGETSIRKVFVEQNRPNSLMLGIKVSLAADSNVFSNEQFRWK